MSTKSENTVTDTDLVTDILGGDRHAFARLIKNTERLVAQLVFNMIPIAADRKDIAQEVYLKVYSNLSKFRFQSKLSTWIGQITYNTCLHHLQKKRPVLLENFYQDDEGNIFILDHLKVNSGGDNETERKLFEKELSFTISRAIQHLPPVQQIIVSLFYQEEFSLLEIAGITGLPEGTLKSHLFRARQQLKQILLKMYKREDL